MTTCFAAYLPTDLGLVISQCLSDDIPSLRALALTSRSWHAATRPFLFRNLTLRAPCQFYALLDILRSSPRVGFYIKTLHLSHFITVTEEFTSYVPDVQEIEFFVGYMFGDWNPASHPILARWQSVKRICFRNYRILPLHIAQVVCLFPLLEQLEVVICFVPYVGTYAKTESWPSPNTPFPPRPPNLRLKNLRLLHANDAARPLLEWLHGIQTLRCVGLQLTTWSNHVIPGFLKSLGSSLQVLELACEDGAFKWSEAQCAAFLSQIDLSVYPSLRTLYFSDTYGVELFPVLQNAPSGQITSIVFRLSAGFKWLKMDHQRLKTVLSLPNFGTLKDLIFVHDELSIFELKTLFMLSSEDKLDRIKLSDRNSVSRREVDQSKSGEPLKYYDGFREKCRVRHVLSKDWIPETTWLWTKRSKPIRQDNNEGCNATLKRLLEI